jgi:hypothetical protein
MLLWLGLSHNMSVQWARPVSWYRTYVAGVWDGRRCGSNRQVSVPLDTFIDFWVTIFCAIIPILIMSKIVPRSSSTI